MFKAKAKKFINKWKWIKFEGNSTITPEFKSFVRWFRTLMKEIWEVDSKSFKAGHFDTSGFIKINDKYIYVSITDVRFNQNWWLNSVLYRTAKDNNDYTGGSNHYSDLEKLEENIKYLSE